MKIQLTPDVHEQQQQRQPAHIAPTVGRVVWYWPGAEDFAQDNVDRMFKSTDLSQPMRADICFVHPDGTVTLSVNDHLGDSYQRPNVTLYQGDDDPRGRMRPFASWMPYQKGQAAKTEAAEQRAQQVSVADVAFDLAKLQLDLAREQVRELRILNDTREITLQAMKTNGFAPGASGSLSGGVQLCAQQTQQLPEVPGMPPHQVRMRFERDELDVRITKAEDFIKTKAFPALDKMERDLLIEQVAAMRQYRRVLQQRIALFKEAQDNA